MVGKKVDAFERNLVSTQSKMERMVVKMNEAAVEQETYREEARAAAKETNSAIEKLQEAQNKLEAKQEEAVLQLQKKVLKELGGKTGGAYEQQTSAITANESNATNSEWIRRAKEIPQDQERRSRDEPIPKNYTDIA